MHFTCAVPKREGIYHIRLYDIDISNDWRSMESHVFGPVNRADGLFDLDGTDRGTPVRGDILYEGFGDMQSAHDNELLQGAIQHDNFKISLEADPVMSVLVASIRNLTKDVWVEITLEQHALDVPDLTPLEHIQPRKERMMFWGKMTRNDATGYVDYQKYKQGIVRDSSAHIHIGGLDLNFIHWLHVRLAMSCSDDLKRYRDSIVIPPDPHLSPLDFVTTPVSKLLMFLVEQCSPTSLVSCVDHHFSEQQHNYSDKLGLTTQISSADANIELFYQLYGAANHIAFYLGEVEIPLWIWDHTGTGAHRYAAIWNYDPSTFKPDHGPFSFFTLFKTYGDALIMLSREFFLRFDHEIPILKEIRHINESPLGNVQQSRIKRWSETTRWAFVNIDAVTAEIATKPINKTIKYTPAAVWISHLKIAEPNVGGLQDANWMDFDAEWINPIPEGKDISYTTLFRFVGKSYVPTHGSDGEDSGGAELYVNGLIFGGISAARNASFDGVTLYDQWNNFHVFNQVNLWGGARALVEFDHSYVGITPFGDGVKDFGFDDYGDYANLRRFDGSPGLLYEGSDFAHFSVIEIKRTPGGDSHIRGIERIVLHPVDIIPPVAPPPPDDPPDPPITTPPTNILEPICGMISFMFGVEFSGDVCGVLATIDGMPTGAIPIEAGPLLVAIQVIINACAMLIGPHVICITITPCDSRVAPVTTCWPFTVNHTCCGGGTDTFLQIIT